MNELIDQIFGDAYITLACHSGECMHYTQVPGYSVCDYISLISTHLSYCCVGYETTLQTPERPTNSTLVAISAAAAGLVFIIVTAGTFHVCSFLCPTTWKLTRSLRLFFIFLTGLWYIGHQSNTQGFGQIRLPTEEAAKLMADHVPASLRFSDISYTLPGRTILDNITGHLRPGQVTAIMGASGAGKSTFLDILARKQKRGTVSGTMKVNGRFVKDEEFRRIMGFVDQEDTLMATLTVYETVLYSALLRLPREMSFEAKKYRTLETLNELGILAIKDMRIGESGACNLEMA